MVQDIKNAEEFYKLINSKKISIVDFSANWCPACIKMAPMFSYFSNIYTDIQFLRIDVDNLEEISATAEVNGMPTYVVYESGKMTGQRLMGPNSKDLDSLIKSVSKIEHSSTSTLQDPIKIKHEIDEINTKKKHKKKCTLM